MKGKYNSKQFSVSTGVTNYDVKNTGVFFDVVEKASFCSIRTTQTITVKLNDTGTNGIIVKSTDSPYIISEDFLNVPISNIFITNASGSTATVDIEIS